METQHQNALFLFVFVLILLYTCGIENHVQSRRLNFAPRWTVPSRDLEQDDRWRCRARRRDSIGVAAVYGTVACRWRGRRTKHGVREVIAVSAAPFSIVKCGIVAWTPV